MPPSNCPLASMLVAVVVVLALHMSGQMFDVCVGIVPRKHRQHIRIKKNKKQKQKWSVSFHCV